MMDEPLNSTDLQWLVRLSRALLRESHAAEDLVQQTVAATLRQPMPEGAAPRAWLGGIARRLAARHFRTEIRREQRESQAARPEALPSTAELVDRAEVAEQVAAATKRLPDPYRSTILLRFLQGATPAQIAQMQDQPVDTVRWRLRRGLELLRTDLAQRKDSGGWRALLLPLAHFDTQAVASKATSSVNLLSAIATGVAMKSIVIVLIATLSASVWFLWPNDGGAKAGSPSKADGTAELGGSSDQEFSVPEDPTNGRTLQGEIRTSPFVTQGRTDRPSTVKPVQGLRGIVVDESGRPIDGAIAYLFQTEVLVGQEPAPTNPTILSRTETNEVGSFSISNAAWAKTASGDNALSLGVVANGFLRRVVQDVLKQNLQAEFRIVMQRGSSLRGRIVDPEGRSLPDIALIAHCGERSISHVSPSQMRLRAGRAALGNASSTYFHCLARSDAQGEFIFTGLPKGAVQIRTLDPSWMINELKSTKVGGPFVILTATPAFGVRLEVFDAATGDPVKKTAARFRADVAFENGESEDCGQWVGRGTHRVSFALRKDLISPTETRKIARAVFYGTVRVNGIRTAWRAKPIEQPGTIAVVRVLVNISIKPTETDAHSAPSSTPTNALPPSTLALDVRYSNGNPFEGRLVVSFISRSKNGATREGNERLTAIAPARYELQVPSGKLDLQVAEFGASGSLPAWSGIIQCNSGRTAEANITLPLGATITINRPRNWKGALFVHASYRTEPNTPWRGSWNYGTETGPLTLRALRAAEWRFQLRMGSESAPDPLIRTITLVDGEHATIRE